MNFHTREWIRRKSALRTLGWTIAASLALSACGPPATLKSRNGYWADQSHDAQAYNHRVRFLVLHYTDDRKTRALKLLTGPNVSVHYVVGRQPRSRDGKPIVYQLVPERKRAWHAGVSGWAGRRDLNDTSIGIEIVNRGPIDSPTGPIWQPFPPAQIAAVIALARDIVARYDIKPQNVVGHADIAPGRKIDPGPAFPWHRLYEAGIGAWPDAATVAFYRARFQRQMPTIGAIQAELARYGYAIDVSGVLDARTRAVLQSFQMHFRPQAYDGLPDVETAARLWALNDKYHRP